MASNKNNRVTLTLRLPPDLHAQLTDSADETSKSMNAEIIERLRSTFDTGKGIDQAAAGELLERIFRGVGQLSAEQVEVLRTLCSSLEKKK